MSSSTNDKPGKAKISSPIYNILFVSSELHPFAKTGGLGDVSNSLPKALKALDQDIRVLIPAYPFAIQKAESVDHIATIVATISLPEKGFPGSLGLSSKSKLSSNRNFLLSHRPCPVLLFYKPNCRAAMSRYGWLNPNFITAPAALTSMKKARNGMTAIAALPC